MSGKEEWAAAIRYMKEEFDPGRKSHSRRKRKLGKKR